VCIKPGGEKGSLLITVKRTKGRAREGRDGMAGGEGKNSFFKRDGEGVEMWGSFSYPQEPARRGMTFIISRYPIIAQGFSCIKWGEKGGGENG